MSESSPCPRCKCTPIVLKGGWSDILQIKPPPVSISINCFRPSLITYCGKCGFIFDIDEY